MNDVAIKLDGLSKTFGKGAGAVHALRGIDLEVAAGQVYGFLGPNGAGKTTTIRLITRLLYPTSGSADVLGRPIASHPEVLGQVGAMIEEAAFYGHLTARDNLRVLQYTRGHGTAQRAEQLLEQMGLSEAADRRVSGFSTGMKQRLGIAAALLHDPSLVILDEPTNGLDPAGIIDIRRFIRGLADSEGKTVFLSSHQLHEVEQICDRVAIIDHGQVLREGSVADLLNSNASTLRVQAEPRQTALDALHPRWQVHPEGEWLEVQAGPDDSPEIVRLLVAAGVEVRQVIYRQQSLEDFFMSVTGEQVRSPEEPGE